jgi:hypothetical protein
MKKASIIFLKAVLVFTGILVLSLCIYLLPDLIQEDDLEFTFLLLGLYVSAIPFLIALYHGVKILSYIDKNTTFSESSVKSLKYIKYCALAVSVLYLADMPFIFYIAEQEDAPGVAALGFIFIFASFIVSVLAALLERLVKDAIEIKSENDLTI